MTKQKLNTRGKTKPSKLELAADLLERHNTWRRGKDDGTPMVGAKELGQAIDTAVKHMRAGL